MKHRRSSWRQGSAPTWSTDSAGRPLAAVACFEEDFDARIAHLHLRPAHRKVTGTTNLLERLFVAERRRVKAALHQFDEPPVLKLMYAALVRGGDAEGDQHH